MGSKKKKDAAWLAAFAIVMVAVFGKALFPTPRIDEGHNVFIVDGRGGALEQGLPVEAFALMLAAFDAQYPPEHRCDPKSDGCWRAQGFPDRAYAFSADGIFDRSAYSRRVTGIDFEDATWQRLGFINENKYNWNAAQSDLDRASRLRGADVFRHPWQAVFHQWRLTMPWFVMYRFPADFVGSRLCWTGDALWEGPLEKFTAQRHATMDCRTIEASDVGRRIFGVTIAQDAPLAMRLQPTAKIQAHQLIEPLLALIGTIAVLGFLLRWRSYRPVLPFALVATALIVVLLNDAS